MDRSIVPEELAPKSRKRFATRHEIAIFSSGSKWSQTRLESDADCLPYYEGFRSLASFFEMIYETGNGCCFRALENLAFPLNTHLLRSHDIVHIITMDCGHSTSCICVLPGGQVLSALRISPIIECLAAGLQRG